MEVLAVRGGTPLRGVVACGGAKNAALPIMAAAILADEPVELSNVPRVADVDTLSLLLGHLGVETKRGVDGIARLATVDSTSCVAPSELVRKMRASFCVLGPLLARRGRAIVPLPGGCAIGSRPVDLHLRGLAALGAELRVARGRVSATAKRLTGAIIDMAGPRGPTVTGTANVLMAATLARGETIITHAATEPEIVDLADFLVGIGARVEGAGSHTIRVLGVERLGGARHTIIGDRVEAVTLLLAAAASGGEVTVRGVEREHVAAELAMLASVGCHVEAARRSVHVSRRGPLRAATIEANHFPAIATDTQPLWMAALATARGVSLVRDHVFPDRFRHVVPLAKMGAKIRLGMESSRIEGVDRLRAAVVTPNDLRAAAALVLAGLTADGTTIVRRVDHLDRGYERLEDKLTRLGARVDRVASPIAPHDDLVGARFQRRGGA